MSEKKETKRKYLSLKEKKVIAEDFNNGNTNKMKLAKKHNVSYQVIRTVTSQVEKLINHDSNASFLQKSYVTQQHCNKYINIDNFILTKIETIREKGGIISRLTIKRLGEKFNEKIEPNIP